MLEVVDAEAQAASDLFHAVAVCDDWTCLTGARFRRRHAFGVGHLILVDQLDDVDTHLHDLLDFAFASSAPLTPQRNSFSYSSYGAC